MSYLIKLTLGNISPQFRLKVCTKKNMMIDHGVPEGDRHRTLMSNQKSTKHYYIAKSWKSAGYLAFKES